MGAAIGAGVGLGKSRRFNPRELGIGSSRVLVLGTFPALMLLHADSNGSPSQSLFFSLWQL